MFKPFKRCEECGYKQDYIHLTKDMLNTCRECVAERNKWIPESMDQLIEIQKVFFRVNDQIANGQTPEADPVLLLQRMNQLHEEIKKTRAREYEGKDA